MISATDFNATRALHKAIDGIEAGGAVSAAFDLLINTGAIRDVSTGDLHTILARVNDARQAFERAADDLDNILIDRAVNA